MVAGGRVLVLCLCCLGGMERLCERDLSAAGSSSELPMEYSTLSLRREPQHLLHWCCAQRPCCLPRRLRLHHRWARRQDVSHRCQGQRADQAGGDRDVPCLRHVLHPRRELQPLRSREQGGRLQGLRALRVVRSLERVEHCILFLRRFRRHYYSSIRSQRSEQRPSQQHLLEPGDLDCALHAGRLRHVWPRLLHSPGSCRPHSRRRQGCRPGAVLACPPHRRRRCSRAAWGCGGVALCCDPRALRHGA
mmetsp:Transcript_14465/g.49417  ORF Transcript_14465/g.49417 Transcript_14465/m.49417 type:complete len:248 (+) Transcript_14465:435-1178(+)